MPKSTMPGRIVSAYEPVASARESSSRPTTLSAPPASCTGRVPNRVTNWAAISALAIAATPIGRNCRPVSSAVRPRTCCRKIAVRKNIARNAAPFSARATIDVLRPRERNMPSGTSGAGERASTRTKAKRSATPPASSAMTSSDDQPSGSARITPSTMASRPAVPSRAPARSNVRRPAGRTRDSAMNSGTTAARTTAIGTLTRNTQRQLSESTSKPPAITPSVPPRPARPPQMPIAMLRSRPCANVTVRMANAAGESIAPPRPCTARITISWSGVCARPATRDVSPKTSRPAMKSRRRPIRSAARPPRSRKPPKNRVYALITHCRPDGLKPRSACMWGSATFTIVTSNTTMNWARASTVRADHGLRLTGSYLRVRGAALCGVHVHRRCTSYMRVKAESRRKL